MTQTLSSAALAVARKITDVIESVATGGSATTLIDTGFPGRSGVIPENDWYNGGVIYHLSGSRTGVSIPTDWVQSTYTFTIPTGTAVAATNRYAVHNADYPWDVLVSAVNRALENMPSVPDMDATLIVVADQEAYTLPASVYDIREVSIERSMNLSGDNPVYYRDNKHWRERDGKIYFDPGWYPSDLADAGDTIRLWYYAKQSALTAATDAISDYLPVEWLSLEAAIVALEWRAMMLQGNEPIIAYMLKNYQTMQPKVRAEHMAKIPKLAPKVRLANY